MRPLTVRILLSGFVALALAWMIPVPADAGNGADPDGRYRGAFSEAGEKFGSVELRVKRDGRLITGFGGNLIGVCYQPERGPETVPFPFWIGRVAVEAGGGFRRAFTVKQKPYDQEYKLAGKLRNGTVEGRLELHGACEVDARLAARRIP